MRSIMIHRAKLKHAPLNPFPSISFGERQLGAMPIARTARTAQYGPAARRQLVQ